MELKPKKKDGDKGPRWWLLQFLFNRVKVTKKEDDQLEITESPAGSFTTIVIITTIITITSLCSVCIIFFDFQFHSKEEGGSSY